MSELTICWECSQFYKGDSCSNCLRIFKQKARKKLEKALQYGRMARPDHCENCNTICKPQGHHNDYSKPLEVEWLCVPCHTKHHKNANRLDTPLPYSNFYHSNRERVVHAQIGEWR